MAAFVSKDKCTSCEQCIKVCPTEAIEMVKEKAKVIVDECIYCETCVDECPADAIKMK